MSRRVEFDGGGVDPETLVKGKGKLLKVENKGEEGKLKGRDNLQEELIVFWFPTINEVCVD